MAAKLLDLPMRPTELDKTTLTKRMRRLDVDGSKSIDMAEFFNFFAMSKGDFEEFIQEATARPSLVNLSSKEMKAVRRLFREFDEDGDGYINMHELQLQFPGAGEAEGLMKMFSQSGGGVHF